MKKNLLLSLAFIISLGLLSVKAQEDVGVISLTSVSSDCQHTATETVTVEIENFGTVISATDTIPVYYQINSLAIVEDTIFIASDFNNGDTISFSFAVTADLSAVDTFDFVIGTNYDTDVNTANDVLNTTVYTYGYPAITLTSDLTICLGDTTELIVSGNHSYLWNTTETTDTITITPTVNTDYMVIVTDTVTGCSISDTVTVTVANVNALVSANTTACSGSSVQLNAAGGVDYLWSNGDTTATATVYPTDSTWYYVTVSIASCNATDSVLVEVFDNNVIFPNDTFVCAGDSVALTAAGGVSYLWNTTETTEEIIVTPTDTTTYSITIIDDNVCSYTANVLVSYIDIPTIAASVNDTTVCSNYSVVVSATGADTYTWDNNAIYTGTGATATLYPASSIEYIVTGILNGCASTDTINVTTIASPDINLSEEYTLNPENEIVLAVTSGYSSYLWSTGETVYYIALDGSTMTAGTHNYWVEASSTNGCVTRDSAIVIVGNSISVQSNEITKIEIFPNPANEFVNISNSVDNFNYQIISINGSIIESEKVEGNKTTIDISEMNNGVYFIKINTNDKIIIKKLIIE